MNTSNRSGGRSRRSPTNGPRADKRRFSSPSRKGRVDSTGDERGEKRSYSRDNKRDDKRPYSRDDNRGEKRSYSRDDNRGEKREYPRKDNRDDKREYPRKDKRDEKRPYSRDNKRDDKREYPRKDKRGDNGQNTRQLILKILSEFDGEPNDPERIAEKILSRGKYVEHRDRRFIFEIVYGVLRNRIYLDYVINTFIPPDRALNLDTVRRVLQMGAYQILFLDRVPDHAAVNEAVEIVKRDRNTVQAAGFVNAVLRNVIKNKHGIVLPDPQVDLSGRLSVEFSHPKWMVERWLARYGMTNAKKILAFNNERPAIYLRRRMRDITRQLFELDVRTLCEPAGGYLNLYYKMKVALDPESLRLLKNGQCVVQAPSSGWVVALLGLQSGGRVLDMCCAPGGKATLMAEIVSENGLVTACDRYMWKMKTAVENINNLNLANIFPLVCDGTRPPFKGKFKAILLDAPCTGTGVLQRHPDGRFVRTAEDVENMRELQRQLLESAANMVEDGGDIVYSTCSLEPEENEQQVEWFLNAHPEFTLIPPPSCIPANFVDGNDCLRITPFEHGMDGIFGAKFRKRG